MMQQTSKENESHSTDKAKLIYIAGVVVVAAIVTILRLLLGTPTGQPPHFFASDYDWGVGITILMVFLKLLLFVLSSAGTACCEVIINGISYSINRDKISTSFAICSAIIVALAFNFVLLMLELFGVYIPGTLNVG